MDVNGQRGHCGSIRCVLDIGRAFSRGRCEISERNEVTLESLVGEHELSGVDMGQRVIESSFEGLQNSATCSFILDGKTYTAIEDPSDGYRSMLGSLLLEAVSISNTFTPQRVICTHQIQARGQWKDGSDLLVMRDVVTGSVVLTIGTDNVDDYYPSFVAEFDPKAMACNQPHPVA